jgi:hypothetical protein
VILISGTVQMALIPKTQIGKDFCFSLTVPGREYVMAASSGILRDEWMAILRAPKKWWEQLV